MYNFLESFQLRDIVAKVLKKKVEKACDNDQESRDFMSMVQKHVSIIHIYLNKLEYQQTNK